MRRRTFLRESISAVAAGRLAADAVAAPIQSRGRRILIDADTANEIDNPDDWWKIVDKAGGSR